VIPIKILTVAFFTEGIKMLRSMVISNELLRHLAKKINEEVDKGNTITRSFLSNTIWDFERGKPTSDETRH